MASRRYLVWVIAVAFGAQGCYEYVAVDRPTDTVGKLVQLRITDPGRVSLASRFGPGLDRVEGKVVSQRDSDLMVSVLSVTNVDGENTRWSGESVQLNRSFVGTVKSRRISPTRTAVFATAAAAVVYFTAGKALTGHGKDPPDPGEPTDPPLSHRIPISIGIRGIR